jgi:hypothetical protein
MACQIAVARSLIMQALLNRLSHVSPIPVMVRATLENVLSPEAVNRIFVEHAVSQSQRVLLFSNVVELMMLVVCRLVTVHGLARRPSQLLGACERFYSADSMGGGRSPRKKCSSEVRNKSRSDLS